MEYIIIFTIQLLGIAFHVVQKVNTLDKQYPEKSIRNLQPVLREWVEFFISISIGAIRWSILPFIMTHTFRPFGNVNNSSANQFNDALPRCFLHRGLRPGLRWPANAYKYLGKAEQYLSDKAN